MTLLAGIVTTENYAEFYICIMRYLQRIISAGITYSGELLRILLMEVHHRQIYACVWTVCSFAESLFS